MVNKIEIDLIVMNGWIVLVLVFLWKLSPYNFISKLAEGEAIYELSHIVFGILLGATFDLLFDNKKRVFIMSFIMIMLLEIYEVYNNYIFRNLLITTPIDTILDIILGLGFSMLYVKSIEKVKYL